MDNVFIYRSKSDTRKKDYFKKNTNTQQRVMIVKVIWNLGDLLKLKRVISLSEGRLTITREIVIR